MKKKKINALRKIKENNTDLENGGWILNVGKNLIRKIIQLKYLHYNIYLDKDMCNVHIF